MIKVAKPGISLQDRRSADPSSTKETPTPVLGAKFNRTVRALGVIVAAFILSMLLLKFMPFPFIWMWVVWAGALGSSALLVCGKTLRPVLVNLAVGAIMLAGVEAYFSFFARKPKAITYDGSTDPRHFVIRDDVLGTVPRKGAVHVRESVGEKVLFETTYTIGPNGLRISAPSRESSYAASVLFFGCSYTFGHGLGDEETLPYQVYIQSRGRYRTFNFGFEGYGPHQMLAQIESGMVGRIVNSAPRYAIYSGFSEHIARVAGKVPWGRHGPRYQLAPDGSVQLVGHFDASQASRHSPPHESPLQDELRWQLSKSALYNALDSALLHRLPVPSEADARLLLAIVRRSRDLLVAEYPGIQFHVILWKFPSDDERVVSGLQRGFEQMGISVHPIEEILPDFDAKPTKYLISSEDGHPNAQANRMIADYVVNKILASRTLSYQQEIAY
jgi:hypothetical protein